jgi:hypothetical protein
MTSRADGELSPLGILWGRSLIDPVEFSKLNFVALLLQQVARSMGRGVSPSHLWNSIPGAAVALPAGQPQPIIGDRGARSELVRICRTLNGSKALILDIAEDRMPPLVIRAAEMRLRAADRVTLEGLRHDLADMKLPAWVLRAADEDRASP